MPRMSSQPEITPIAVSPATAARMPGLGVTHLGKLLSRGEIASFWSGTSRRIPVQAIHDFVARRLADSANPPPHHLRNRGAKARPVTEAPGKARVSYSKAGRANTGRRCHRKDQ